MTVAWDKELLKIINEQTRGVRFQSVMTVTDEGSQCAATMPVHVPTSWIVPSEVGACTGIPTHQL